jgi:hypothetical protein
VDVRFGSRHRARRHGDRRNRQDRRVRDARSLESSFSQVQGRGEAEAQYQLKLALFEVGCVLQAQPVE